ncbi:MAG TPA: tRNA pseudouridine(38-40) synthase TruA [Gemmatimonadales bacterium]|nr:tRNA pseudouridine(38-40) synthase TruA [Gemmatimonadales bacterium]
MQEISCYAILHYLGHTFQGWQRQAAGRRTVQGDFERVLERLTGRRVVTHAAGRTDAGVHALGQVVSFRVPARWQPPELHRAINALLPPEIWVARLGRAPDGFHARRHALSRCYRYVVGCDAASASPFRRPFEWSLGTPLDPDALSAAASPLTGEHDFQAFAAAGSPKRHYLCRVSVARWDTRPAGEGFIFTIEADRFLHRMVRFLVGTMVDVGRGRRPVQDVPRLLLSRTNAETSPPAPPEGLYFVGARYSELERDADR